MPPRPKTYKKKGPFSCDQCKKVFPRHKELVIHSYVHGGDRPHKCGICNRGFVTIAAMRLHVFTHTGEKPFVCELCDKSYKSRWMLRQHCMSHTGEKPYQCQACEKCFSTDGKRSRHHRTMHVKELKPRKQYACDLCQRVFKCSAHLISHLKFSHIGESSTIQIAGTSGTVKTEEEDIDDPSSDDKINYESSSVKVETEKSADASSSVMESGIKPKTFTIVVRQNENNEISRASPVPEPMAVSDSAKNSTKTFKVCVEKKDDDAKNDAGSLQNKTQNEDSIGKNSVKTITIIAQKKDADKRNVQNPNRIKLTDARVKKSEVRTYAKRARKKVDCELETVTVKVEPNDVKKDIDAINDVAQNQNKIVLTDAGVKKSVVRTYAKRALRKDIDYQLETVSVKEE